MVVAPLGQLLNLDRGFFHTALRLTVRPGDVVRDHLVGRGAYTHPVLYLLITFAVFALLARWTGAVRPAPESDPSWMLPVVFVAAASRLLFWRARLNYAEHLILSCYLVGHLMLFVAVMSVPQYLAGWSHSGTVGLVVLGLSVAYIGWAYSRFFDRRRLLAAAGGVVAVVGGTALFVAAFLAIMAAILNAMRTHGMETVGDLLVFYLRRL